MQNLTYLRPISRRFNSHLAPPKLICCLALKISLLLTVIVPAAKGQLPELLRTDLRVRVDWVTNPADPRLQQVVALLHAFNNRLYDATDGQWRIRKFNIYDVRGPVGMEDKGVGHFHEVWETSHGDKYSALGDADPKCHACPPDYKYTVNLYALKKLSNPSHFHLGLDKFENTSSSLNDYGGVMVMEFLHSWTGLLDEYLNEHKEEGGKCAEDLTKQGEWSTCIMYDPRHLTELCRPSTHSRHTYQQAAREMDCYTWLQRVFKENGKGRLVVPSAVIVGPTVAPMASIVYHLGPPTKWMRDERIVGQTSKKPPALAATGTTLHMVHIGDESNDIWYSSSIDGGQTWTGNRRIPDQTSKATPALAAVGTTLHMLHLGNTDNTIWYSRSTNGGENWSANVAIPNQKSKASPALAVINNTLHMVHLGDVDNTIWYSRSSDGGQHWTDNKAIPHQKSKASPALIAVGNTLHLVYIGNSDNTIWHSQSNDGGQTWSTNVAVPRQKSKATPALAVIGNVLHMVHLGDEDNTIWHSHYDGEWHTNVKILDQSSKASPSLISIGNTLHMVHLGDEENAIWHSIGVYQ